MSPYPPHKTKIVCTIGPATESEAQLESLVHAGMSVARLNFSHGDHAWHRAVIQRVRRVSERLGRPVAVLQDLCGPRIRVSELPGPELLLSTGDQVTLAPAQGQDEPEGAWMKISLPTLHQEVEAGERVLLADGAVALRVEGGGGAGISCVVEIGGRVRRGAGVNLPDTDLRVPAMTAKDLEDLALGVAEGVDWIALSFVRARQDVLDLKARLAALGADIPVIAKIEKPQALRDLEAILDAADGAMVARGDLGVETDLAEVPLAQRRIIRACVARSLPVITATQMLESMITSATPTRAEVADLAHAVMDGTDAVMLSAETSVGEHPIAACATAARICQRIATASPPQGQGQDTATQDVEDAVADAAALIADRLDATAILACTMSGSTARLMSAQRPRVPILAVTSSPSTYQRLSLVWGVDPVIAPPAAHIDAVMAEAVRCAQARGVVLEGRPYVITAGHPTGEVGSTNLIRVGVG